MEFASCAKKKPLKFRIFLNEPIISLLNNWNCQAANCTRSSYFFFLISPPNRNWLILINEILKILEWIGSILRGVFLHSIQHTNSRGRYTRSIYPASRRVFRLAPLCTLDWTEYRTLNTPRLNYLFVWASARVALRFQVHHLSIMLYTCV